MKKKFSYVLAALAISCMLYSEEALDVRRDTFGVCDEVYFSVIKFTQVPVASAHPFSRNINGDLVMFSPGNLQYSPGRKTWRFARQQWAIVGDGVVNDVMYDSIDAASVVHWVKSNNCLIAARYRGWVDLFGWGTAGYQPMPSVDPYVTYTKGYSFMQTEVDATHNMWGYGPSTGLANVDDHFGPTSRNMRYDWGQNNPVYSVYPCYLTTTYHHNKATTTTIVYDSTLYPPGEWRVPTADEWNYIISTRKIEEGDSISWTCARISYDATNAGNTRNGIILFPDDFEKSAYDEANPANPATFFYGQKSMQPMSYSTWRALDSMGCIFLPLAGQREVQKMYRVNQCATYWSSMPVNTSKAYGLFVSVNDSVEVFYDELRRCSGAAVRMIRNFTY